MLNGEIHNMRHPCDSGPIPLLFDAGPFKLSHHVMSGEYIVWNSA